MNDEPNDAIRRADHVCERFGIGWRGLYKWIAAGKFPKPDMKDGRNGWRESTLRAYEAKRQNEKRRPEAPSVSVISGKVS